MATAREKEARRRGTTGSGTLRCGCSGFVDHSAAGDFVFRASVPALFVFALYACRGQGAGNLAGGDYWR